MENFDLTKQQIIKKYRGKISPSLLLQVLSDLVDKINVDLGDFFEGSVKDQDPYYSKIYQYKLWEQIVTYSDLNKLNKFLSRWDKIFDSIFHLEMGWIEYGVRDCLDKVDHLLEKNNLRDKLTNCIDTKLIMKGVQ